ncbi:MAG: hydantoinase B/oxoprolinase family protein [Alphaproteobacteria bacterium]|nr:hydantoinase B/oxoprolinase family protein [Alphaproteobacteria bacterium]
MRDHAEIPDPVALGILWDRLISITDEAVSALLRASFSTVVTDGYDLSVILLDVEGNAIAQGTQSIPSFTGSAPATLRHMLRRFPPERLAPGDVLCTNDPWLGTGHLYDISVMRPIFRRGRIVAYSMSITHLPDVGGFGYGTGATEIYQEGLRLPVVKLVDAGRPSELLLDLFRANTRVPEQVVGDVLSNVTCNQVCGRQLLEFMDDYGLDDLRALSLGIRAASERAVRDRIRALQPGRYAETLQVEGIDDPITLACAATVAEDRIAVDFSGTSGCVAGGINVPFTFTMSYALYALKCLIEPAIPNNSGATAPFAFTAPEGCILNALPPSATAIRNVVGWLVVPLLFRALAPARPMWIQADSGMNSALSFRGRNRSGRTVTTLYLSSGGLGASDVGDGAPTRSTPANVATIPIEVWEALTGVTVEGKRLLTDSGGPGKCRGGLGQDITLRNDSTHPYVLDVLGFRTDFPARGLADGQPGRLRETHINGRLIPPKGRHILEPGDRLRRLEAGGGGFGEAAERPLEAVLADVRQGYVSVAGARRDYSVEVDLASGTARRS